MAARNADVARVLSITDDVLVADSAHAQQALRAISGMYAALARSVKRKQKRFPQSLLTDGFDQEQVWAQLDVMNEPIFDMLSTQLDVVDAVQAEEKDQVDEAEAADEVTRFEEEDKDEEEEAYEQAQAAEASEEENEDDEEASDEEGDQDEAEEEEETDEEDVLKAMQSGDEDDAEDKDGDEDDDGDDDDDALDFDDLKSMTTFERHQLEMAKQIEELEAENAARKKWQLSGEADAKRRPQNSLLEEFVEYDHLAAPPPDSTTETSQKLEDVIKQRIIDNLFDDVQRRFEQTLTTDDNMKPEVSQEKSKLSLAEVYEQDYLETTKGAVTSAAERRVQKQHEQVKQLMMEIEDELNALTNAHYLPMRPTVDLTVSTTAPAVTLEDVTPTAIADSDRQAPQEIKKKEKLIFSKAEATDTDRKRERRKKKRTQHFDRLKQEKLEQQLDKGEVTETVAQAKDRALKKLQDKAKKGENVTILDSSKSIDEQLAKNKIFQSLKREVEQEAEAILASHRPKKAKRSSKSGLSAIKL